MLLSRSNNSRHESLYVTYSISANVCCSCVDSDDNEIDLQFKDVQFSC